MITLTLFFVKKDEGWQNGVLYYSNVVFAPKYTTIEMHGDRERRNLKMEGEKGY